VEENIINQWTEKIKRYDESFPIEKIPTRSLSIDDLMRAIEKSKAILEKNDC